MLVLRLAVPTLVTLSLTMRPGALAVTVPRTLAMALGPAVGLLTVTLAPALSGRSTGPTTALQRRPLDRIASRVDSRNGLARELLDVAQKGPLLAVTERDGDAGRSGACRAANAMHIGFRDVRQINVDHVAHAVHVDSTGGDVSRHKHPCPS